jgi:general secretion pathway protein K
MGRKTLHRQRGVAIITALLLTTLAITIVASLFWQQQVQVRSIENQRLQLQKQWILRGALDWAMLILREDLKHSPNDDLTEDWAVPLADTPLDQYVENGREDTDASEATLSGAIVDAQSRYNLRNLSTNGVVDPVEMAVFARLLTNLHLNPQLAKAAADAMAEVQPVVPTLPGSQQSANGSPSGQSAQPGQQAGATPSSGGQPTNPTPARPPPKHVDIVQVDDLLSVPGFTPDVLAKLKDFVIVLPWSTPVNANTATAPVLAARIDGLSLADATALVASRNHAVFKDIADVGLRLNKPSFAPTNLSVATEYFLVNGRVNLSRASLTIQSLVHRSVQDPGSIVWIREN